MRSIAQQLREIDFSVTELADGTAVILDLQNEVLLTLNESAAFMLSCLREGDDQENMVQRVVARYEVAEEIARKDIAGLIEELAAATTPSRTP